MKYNPFYFVKSFNRYTKQYEIDALATDCTCNNIITCYSHVGQHCSAARDFGINRKAAKFYEYESLLDELKSIGYNPLPLTRSEWLNETKKEQKHRNNIEKFNSEMESGFWDESYSFQEWLSDGMNKIK